ncbi:MAG: diaminopimelate epimerase [Chlamydiales bacterium]
MGSSLLSKKSNDLALFKYSGAGNTFLIYDARSSTFPFVLIPRLCAEYAVDGVILLCNSAIADYQVRFFNVDESEAEMCGNGLRCLIRFLEESALKQPVYRIETLSGIVDAWHEGEEIAVQMPKHRVVSWSQRIEGYQASILDVGVPHIVFFVEDVDAIDLNTFGPHVQSLPIFPKSVNVNVVEVHPDHSFHIRTFERGVQRETLSCGTGCTAAALSVANAFQSPSPLTVHTQAKKCLTIHFKKTDTCFFNVVMQGPACKQLSINYTNRYTPWL